MSSSSPSGFRRSDDALEHLIARQFDRMHGAPYLPRSTTADDFRVAAALEFFGSISQNRLIDVGCGKGRLAEHLLARGAFVFGVDPSSEMLAPAGRIRGLALALASATALPSRDGSFDFAVCAEVLQHIPHPERAVREVARVLRKGGKALFIDRNALALDKRTLLPVTLAKRLEELRGKWMYPRDFPFREHRFLVWKMKRLIGNHFSQVKVSYLKENWMISPRPKHALHWFVYTLLPFVREFVAWKAVK